MLEKNLKSCKNDETVHVQHKMISHYERQKLAKLELEIDRLIIIVNVSKYNSRGRKVKYKTIDNLINIIKNHYIHINRYKENICQNYHVIGKKRKIYIV